MYLCRESKTKTMSEAELLLVNVGDNATIYTLQFLSEDESEFERFYAKFKEETEYSEDLMRIVAFIDKIADCGALERFFRPEGKCNDGVCALPVVKSKLRLYCLRLSDRILILGNGGVKSTRTYGEDDALKGYVMTLQKFEKLLRDEVSKGTVIILTSEIVTDKTFEL